MTLQQLLAIVGAFVALHAVPSLAEEQKENDYDQFPELAPARCAKLPPDEVYQLLRKSAKGWDSSYRGEDEAYFAYQKQLQRYVDANYPGAVAYRAELQAAYRSMTNFLIEIWSPQRLGHIDMRDEAWAEWAILRGEKSRFWPKSSVTTVMNLENYCLKLAGKFDHGSSYSTVALPPLHEAIGHLLQATSSEREAEQLKQWFYAEEMQHYVARYDKPEKKPSSKKRKR